EETVSMEEIDATRGSGDERTGAPGLDGSFPGDEVGEAAVLDVLERDERYGSVLALAERLHELARALAAAGLLDLAARLELALVVSSVLSGEDLERDEPLQALGLAREEDAAVAALAEGALDGVSRQLRQRVQRSALGPESARLVVEVDLLLLGADDHRAAAL